MTGFFRRINFFKGLFMQAEDWQKEQEYHIEKQRFHNKYLHTPGVACLEEGGLKVTAAREGTAFKIEQGLAFDGDGRDLYLPEPLEIKMPARDAYSPPSTIYLSIQRNDNKEDERINDANPDYSGFASVCERTDIKIGTDEPDNINQIELARIALTEDGTYIQDAANPFKPGPDEIDLTHVHQAGARLTTVRKKFSFSDFGEKVLDTSIHVRVHHPKKEEDTNIFIEKTEIGTPPPMYIVHVQALDKARIQWWIRSMESDDSVQYSLHIRNDSNRTTTALCRVFKVDV